MYTHKLKITFGTNPLSKTGHLINIFQWWEGLRDKSSCQVSQELVRLGRTIAVFRVKTVRALSCLGSSVYEEVYLGLDSPGLIYSPGQTWLWEEHNGRGSAFGWIFVPNLTHEPICLTHFFSSNKMEQRYFIGRNIKRPDQKLLSFKIRKQITYTCSKSRQAWDEVLRVQSGGLFSVKAL